MKIFRRPAWLAACCVMLAFQTRADEWPTYAHDDNHTSRSPASFDPRALQFAWKAPTGYAMPIIVGNSVIATKQESGTTPTVVSSFNVATGSTNWSYSALLNFPSPAAYGNGLVAIVGGTPGVNEARTYVLDAATGAFKYNVPIGTSGGLQPLIRVNPVTGITTAYVGQAHNVIAVGLGASSGSVLFNASGMEAGGSSIPTVLDNSLLMAGPYHFYAIDSSTGVKNQFHNGGATGGGGTTIAADALAKRFYVLEGYGDGGGIFTGYSYANNSSITQLWTADGTGLQRNESVAIGPTGKLYSVDNNTLTERDPLTGGILRSVGGTFTSGETPIVQGHFLWVYGTSETDAYDLDTLTLIRTLPGSRGTGNSPYDTAGALADNHFLLDHSYTIDGPGFDVYVAPEPECIAIFALGAFAFRRRRPRR